MKAPFCRSVAIITLVVSLSACSKKEVAQQQPASQPAPSPAPVAATTQPAAGPQSAQPAHWESVNSAIEQKNYDGAVDTLAQIKPQQLSSADRIQYYQQVRNASDALLRAQQSDPRAAQAYQRLTRSVLGR